MHVSVEAQGGVTECYSRDSEHSCDFGDLGTAAVPLSTSAHHHERTSILSPHWLPSLRGGSLCPCPWLWHYFLSSQFVPLAAQDHISPQAGVRERMRPCQLWNVKTSVFPKTRDLGMHPCAHLDPKKDPAAAAKPGECLLV